MSWGQKESFLSAFESFVNKNYSEKAREINLPTYAPATTSRNRGGRSANKQPVTPNQQQQQQQQQTNMAIQQIVQTPTPSRATKEYKCEMCDSTFTSLASMKTHMKQHASKTEYECDQCGRSFARAATLKEHKQIHETTVFSCQYCPADFYRQRDLQAHERNVHQTVEISEEDMMTYDYNAPGVSVTYQCMLCEEHFTDETALQTHVLDHMNSLNKLGEDTQIQYAQTDNDTYCITLQSATEDNTTNANQQQLYVTNGSENILYKCQICDQCFLQQQSLTKHLAEVHGLTRQKCRRCDDTFDTANELRAHMVLRHSNNYRCEICNKEFSYYRNYKAHVLLSHK